MRIFIIIVILIALGLVYFVATQDHSTRNVGSAVGSDMKDLGHDAKRGVEEGVDATKRTTRDASDAVKKVGD